jgi:hypothetical protein
MVAHAYRYASHDDSDTPTTLYDAIEVVELLPRTGYADPLWVVRATKV